MALIHLDLAAGGTVAWPRPGTAGSRYADDGPLEAWAVLLDTVTGPTAPADAPVALVAGTVAGVAGPGLARVTAIGLSPLSGTVAETRAGFAAAVSDLHRLLSFT